MSKRQNNTPGAGRQADSFQRRWHNVTNPGTPRSDIMSSPDPLNDGASPDQIPSSNTRRVTRSQRAHKFLSLGATPRRQAYELDVGRSGSGGRASRGGLVVSVEETDEDGTADEATRRTLLPTTTTTTTVPLKYSIEDESSDVLGSTNATPRPRKTRIRNSNGTPIPKPTTGKRRREPSPPPARTTSRRQETVEDSMESDSIDDLTQRSPTPKRRTRSPRERLVEPSSESSTEPMSRVNTARRSVRRRRYPMAPPQAVGFKDAGSNMPAMVQALHSEDDLQKDITTAFAVAADHGMPARTADAELGSDIWIAAASRDATPRAAAQSVEKAVSQIEGREENRESSVSILREDFEYLPPAASDVSSVYDEPSVGPTTATGNDTIAQGEDFSMILMDSVHSLQASTQGAPPGRYSPIGDDTNLIINNTLEYLRQGEVADQEDEGDDDDDDADTLSGRESGNEPADDEATVSKPVIADLQSRPELEAQSNKSQPDAADLDGHGDLVTSNSRESENEPAEEEVAAPPETEVADFRSEPEIEAQSDKSQPEVADPAEDGSLDSSISRKSVLGTAEEEAAAPGPVVANVEPASGLEGPSDASQHKATSSMTGPESEPVGSADNELEAELDKIVEQEVAHFRQQVEQDVTAEVEAAVTEMMSVELEPEAVVASAPKSPVHMSPAKSGNIRLSPSPRKATSSSPLRYRVFKRYADQAAQTAAAVAQVQETAEDSMMYEDSFSEIPEAILAAAVPREHERMSEYEELDDEQMDEVMCELEASQKQDATSEKATHSAFDSDDVDMGLGREGEQEQQVDDYELPYLSPDRGEAERREDSPMAEVDDENKDDEQEAEEVTEEVAEEQPDLSSDASVAQSETNRLPTPEDSPQGAPIQDAPASARRQPRTHSFFGSPVQAQGLTRPSPTPSAHQASVALQAESAAQNSASPLEETPRNQISSPAQPPQSLPQDSASATHVRPALTSIVRVGRALQSVTSDPPSPEARDRHLGSPFRSSGSKEPRSGSREAEGGRLPSKSPNARVSKSPTARMLTFGRLSQSSLSPHRRSPFRDSTRSVKPPVSASNPPQPNPPRQASVSPQRQSLVDKSTMGIEPPVAGPSPPQPSSQQASVSPPKESLFSESSRGTGLVPPTMSPVQPLVSPQRESLLREVNRSVEPLPPADSSLQDESLQAAGSTLGRGSAASSLRLSPASDTMSWIINEGPISPRLRGDNTLQEVVATSTQPVGRSAFVESSPVLPPFVATEPEAESEEETQAPAEPEPELPPLRADDETDIWELEAERDAMTRRRNQSFGKRTRNQKRAKVIQQKPKPMHDSWMRRGMPRPSNRPWTSNRSDLPAAQRVRTGQTAQLAQPAQMARPAQAARPAVEERGSPSRQDEPARLEEEAEEYSLLARTRAAEEAQNLSESAAKASKFDLSTFFSSPIAIPSMLAKKFFPGKGKPTEAAPAPAPGPEASPLAAPALTTSALSRRAPEMEYAPASVRPQRPKPIAKLSSKSLPVIPPFAPRPGSTLRSGPGAQRASFLFSKQPRNTYSGGAPPPRMQESVDKVETWKRHPRWGGNSVNSNPSGDSPIQPFLRALPPKNASPEKSSLRSPLKPKTPGRVVEFTSSVLSPPEQELRRQKRREAEYRQEVRERLLLPQSMWFDEEDTNRYDPPYLIGVAQLDSGHDQENQGSSDVSMTDAPPLEESDIEPTQPPAAAAAAAAALSQTAWSRQHWLLLDDLLQTRRRGPFRGYYERRSDEYLGKTVKSRGKSMELERWHLDCVDAFKAVVGGWDEGDLAKRLFALIMGEEKRRETLQKKRRAVTFQ
ncbi:hypothetical protein V2A60_001587 [Cordyceps javanica]